MPVYEGIALNDQAVVRKSPATGIKIGALKAGASIKGDRLADGSDRILYLHIFEPLDGWVLAADLNYKKSDALEPEPIRADAVATVISVDSGNTADAEEGAALELARELASSGRKASSDELALLSKQNIFMVRKWGDPIMKKYSFEMAAMPKNLGNSNFQPVPLYDDDGHGGGIDKWLRINKAQIAHLKSLQSSEPGFEVKKKLQWLSEQKGTKRGRGSAYMWDDGQGDLNDKNTNSIRWQAIVYGGQPVIVLGTLSLSADLPDHPRQTVAMARILLYDMDHPDERAIQHATAVRGRGKDLYIPTPLGMTIRAPIWQGQYQFIPEEWLEK